MLLLSPTPLEIILVLLPMSLTRINKSCDSMTVTDRERYINRMSLNWKQDQVLSSVWVLWWHLWRSLIKHSHHPLLLALLWP